MLGNRVKHLPDEPTGSPIRHSNYATWPAHATEFDRDQVRTRREHRSDQAGHYVKLSICIRQQFGVPLLKGDLKSLGGRAGPGFLKPVSGNVATSHLCARPCRNQGELYGAATNIQQPGSRFDAESPEKLLRALLHKTGEKVVISRHPCP